MSIKKEIIIKNEYTVRNKEGKGTRGGSPGSYVTRYMMRKNATEIVAPIRKQNIDDFLLRYVFRDQATEKLDVSYDTVKDKVENVSGLGGVGFGYGQVSLSDEAVRYISEDIQKAYESGKTVMKTVISFDHKYLIKNGLVSPDLKILEPGDYKGHVDQLKLRLAIMNGMKRMGANFDDLNYVGVIQVDTRHVHCHLAMVDKGEGRKNRKFPKQQSGILNARNKKLLRRGIDNFLDESKLVHHLSSAVSYDKQNVTTYVKKWGYSRMLQESLPQFLLSCLPEDRSFWRANTNRKEMRKANAVAKELVEEILAEDDSPLPAAMANIKSYARERQIKENLSQKDTDKLIDEGYKRIVDQSINSIYTLLKTLPKNLLDVRTPMLDIMSLDYEDVLSKAHDEKEDDIVGFSFRLRSYSQRLEYHRKKRKENHDMSKSWEKANEQGRVDPASKALYEHYLFEAQYHAKLAAKYEYFLPFPTIEDQDIEDEWRDLVGYYDNLRSLKMMLADKSLSRMKDSEAAEALGQQIYGQKGARYMALGERKVIEDRLSRMEKTYAKKLEDLKVKLSGTRQKIEELDDGEIKLVEGEEFVFDDVKSLDLHHMGFDFSRNVPMSEKSKQIFVDEANERLVLLQAAIRYVEGTSQSEFLRLLPIKDVNAMMDLSKKLEAEEKPVLVSEIYKLHKAEKVKKSKSVRLSDRLFEEMNENVVQLISDKYLGESIEMQEDYDVE